MRYAGIERNDLAAAPGISVSFFTQGCPHHCPGCHNPETWSYDGGFEFTNDTMEEIYRDLEANGIERAFCVLGGEPMCEHNLMLTYLVIKQVKDRYPDKKIYIWTGYTYEQLMQMNDPKVKMILSMTDVLIDGPFVQELRDITLPMRGSSNQRIIELKEQK